MSTRTILEFNHDYVREIERDPAGAARTLVDLVLDRSLGQERGAREGRHYGIRRLASRHHSDALKVEVGGYVQHQEEAKSVGPERLRRGLDRLRAATAPAADDPSIKPLPRWR